MTNKLEIENYIKTHSIKQKLLSSFKNLLFHYMQIKLKKYTLQMIKLYSILTIFILVASCSQKTQQPCDDSFIRGNNYVLASDFENAKKEFEKSIKADSKNANAFYGLGYTYSVEGIYEKAIENYTKAIELDSKFKLAVIGRGSIYYIVGDYENSEKDFIEVTELMPNFSMGYLYLGNIKSQKADFESALKYYDQALIYDKKNSTTYFSKAICQSYLNRPLDAIHLLKKSIEINPKYGMAYFYKATFEHQLNMGDEACKDFKMAEKLGITTQTNISEFCK
ncbi:tetratricopeptide repeat protein [Chryseobacterium sp.]|uniref:tetratricopeptide repeat protein n=1 Tax=Chryseobacterium sp. TaxID=1871047 RepID=UPI00289C474F|nr:tetratricopeptide repeat protein [Chryseobacterium sp.]